MNLKHKLVAGVIGLAWGAAALAAPSPTGYQFQALSLAGYGSSTAFDVNNQGQVIGQAYPAAIPSSPQTGVLWQGSTAQRLYAVSPGSSSALSQTARINNSGWTAGYGTTTIPATGPIVSTTTLRATLWSPTGTAQDLGTLGGRASSAWGLNDAGVVVGEAEKVVGSNVRHATVWAAGHAFDLGTLGGQSSAARAVNASGVVVGNAATAAGDQHAAVWTQQPWTGQITVTDLGTPGGGLTSLANAINDAGVIVGSSTTAGEAGRKAFVWRNGQATELVGLGGATALAQDINQAGQVVGRSLLADGVTFHAVLWQDGLTVDLNDWLSDADRMQGWTLVAARGINDQGWIAGEAYNRLTGVTSGYLLSVSAVPEPQTGALALAGVLMCLGAASRRRTA